MDILYENKEACCGCGACADICPGNCITMEQDSEGFSYPHINKEKCVDCGRCISVCPFKSKKDEHSVIGCYGCYSNIDEERKRSSSGGVFSLFAKKVISDKGIVFGTAMTADCKKAVVSSAEDFDSLKKLCGSKYLQSDPEDSFLRVKNELAKGRKVLYSGTPCQINGLKNYLGKEYDNLLCLEIICHGVPSPLLWKKYVQYVEDNHNGKMTHVNFRCKEKGWANFGAEETVNGKRFFKSKDYDPFLQMFLKNYCLRPSCYACQAKEHRTADITIGDFWGVDSIMPDMNDGKGVSLVIIRTKKGQQAFSDIQQDCKYKECDYEAAIQKNTAEKHSVPLPAQRKTFFEDLNSKPFKKIISIYLENPIIKKLKKIYRKIVR